VVALSFDVAGEKASVAPPDTHLIDFVRVFVQKAKRERCITKMLRPLQLSLSVNQFHVTPMDLRK
jgi:hypothetical protein